MKAFISTACAAWAACLLASPASADTYAYMTAENGDYGVLDLTSGAFNLCGNSGLTLAGLAVGPKGKLFTSSYHTGGPISTIYTVNPANGALTPVETNLIANTEGIASTTAGKIFALDFGLNLYSINPLNAVATLIGSTKVAIGTTVGVSTGSKTLYMSNNATLYKLNVTTGKATKIGSTGANTITAMVKIGTTLYAGGQAQPPNLLTVNPLTGATTQYAQIMGETSFVYGLVSAPKQTSTACP